MASNRPGEMQPQKGLLEIDEVIKFQWPQIGRVRCNVDGVKADMYLAFQWPQIGRVRCNGIPRPVSAGQRFNGLKSAG